ncbi:MAG: VWA domain-containing protein, partial [Gammaproteobacteria bacterium]|nr:VWA domain-containing protein [Gammaproteobacteria bacterium]
MMELKFQFPQLLALILLVIPAVYYIYRGYALRESMLDRFGKENSNSTVRTWLVSVISFSTLVALLFIAAGPMRVLNSGAQNLTGSYVFMIDVSRSMAARQTCSDLTRLDRARNIISQIITEMPEAKIGFMGVAGLTFVLSEMSYDRQYIFDVLNRGIFIEVVPMPGTDLANAFHVFLEKKTMEPPVYDSVEHVVLLS